MFNLVPLNCFTLKTCQCWTLNYSHLENLFCLCYSKQPSVVVRSPTLIVAVAAQLLIHLQLKRDSFKFTLYLALISMAPILSVQNYCLKEIDSAEERHQRRLMIILSIYLISAHLWSHTFEYWGEMAGLNTNTVGWNRDKYAGRTSWILSRKGLNILVD